MADLFRLLRNTLARWPAYQDVAAWRRGERFDRLGLGDTAVTDFTRSIQPRVRDADVVVPSICPYCGVGGAQLVYVKRGKTVDIPASPINGGTLCPRGAATYLIKEL